MASLGVQGFTPPDWMAEEEQPAELGVLPENWEAVNAFLACATQWQRNQKDDPTGIRYEALELVLRHQRVADPDDCFERVRTMESAALRHFARMRKQ